MCAQQLVSLLVGEDLDHSVSVGDGLCARVGKEGEDSFVIFDIYIYIYVTLCLELLLSVTHACHLRVGIDDSRNGQVVYVRVLPSNMLSYEDAFLLGLVG